MHPAWPAAVHYAHDRTDRDRVSSARDDRPAPGDADLPAGGDIQFGDLQSDAGSGPEDDDSIQGDNR